MTTEHVVLRVDDNDVPLRASLSAFAELETQFGVASLRDLTAIVANPGAGQLIAILTAFAKAAGVADANARFVNSAINLGDALSAIAAALRATKGELQ